MSFEIDIVGTNTPLDPGEELEIEYRVTNASSDAATQLVELEYETLTSTNEYELIEVGAGERWTYSLDDGEVFQNKLIDITAQGAEAQIDANARDWTIRNIGWRGEWDTLNRGYFIRCTVQGGEGLIENVYMGDGARTINYPNGPNGVFVGQNHHGPLTIRRVNIQHVPDNGVYASEAGRGGNGPVIIEDSFAKDMQPAAWRVGSDGSRVENCIAVNCHRGVWARHRRSTVVNCDLSESYLTDLYVAEAGLSVRAPTCTVENTRYESQHVAGNATLNGSSAGDPQRFSPEDVGAPTSAEMAASGLRSDQ